MSVEVNSQGEKLRLIGKIKSAQGIKGQVFALFFSKDYQFIDEIEFFYVGLETKMEVKTIAPHKEGVIVTFEDVKDRNKAESIAGELIYLPDEFFETDEGESLYLSEIENFKVYTNENVFLGVITGFLFNGAHDILKIDHAELNKTYEVPFVDEFVQEIDYENEKMIMQLPEGLLEINEN